MTIDSIFVAQFGEDAIDAMAARADKMIDDLGMEFPIAVVLFDALGGELARFVLGRPDPTEASCNAIEAEMRSQAGASLKMVDANGVDAEVILVICAAGMLQ